MGRKGTKAIGLLAVSAVLWTGLYMPADAAGVTVVPSAGVGQILEADLAEEDYLAAAEEAKNERRAIYGFSNLGIANVSNYLNVREEPSEDGKLVGKMSKNSGCEVYDITDGWAHIKSGRVTGYVKAEFLLTGKDARDRADQVATDMAVCNSGGLRVREEPSTESPVITLVAEGEELEVVEQLDGWVKIMLDDEEAYVSADYVDIAKKLERAVTQTELVYGKGVSDVRVDLSTTRSSSWGILCLGRNQPDQRSGLLRLCAERFQKVRRVPAQDVLRAERGGKQGQPVRSAARRSGLLREERKSQPRGDLYRKRPGDPCQQRTDRHQDLQRLLSYPLCGEACAEQLRICV